ncbi:MAG: sigma-70 family RNA polymerase sigma factor [Acidimicrobiales bacterium]
MTELADPVARHATEPDPSPMPGIEDIVREHSAAMYRVAISVVHDHALAEDVVQESVVKAWQALSGFRGDSSVRTWLLRITHNTAISALRKRRDDVVPPDDLPERAGNTSVEDSALVQADRDEIWEALRRLDPVSRAIVVLREVDRMSYEEIAEVLDLPAATVRTRLFRARQQLVRSSSARAAFEAGVEGGVA